MRRTRILLPLIASLGAAATLAACGSSSRSGTSKVAVKTYAHSFCTAVTPFAQDIVTRSSALNLAQIKSPAQGKQAIVGYLTAIDHDTASALTKLRQAGTPDVTNGAQISTAVIQAFAQLHAAMDKSVAEAQKLPTSTAQALRQASLTLDNDIRSSVGGVGQHLQSSALKNPQLEKAVAADSGCRALAGA